MTRSDAVETRSCPRCETQVPTERHDGVRGGVTWLWRCACGWSGAVTESGMVAREGVRRAVGEALGGDTED